MFVKPERVYDMHAVSQKLLKGNQCIQEYAQAWSYSRTVSAACEQSVLFCLLDRKLQNGGCYDSLLRLYQLGFFGEFCDPMHVTVHDALFNALWQKTIWVKTCILEGDPPPRQKWPEIIIGSQIILQSVGCKSQNILAAVVVVTATAT